MLSRLSGRRLTKKRLRARCLSPSKTELPKMIKVQLKRPKLTTGLKPLLMTSLELTSSNPMNWLRMENVFTSAQERKKIAQRLSPQRTKKERFGKLQPSLLKNGLRLKLIASNLSRNLASITKKDTLSY
jgi:hypothetical protein